MTNYHHTLKGLTSNFLMKSKVLGIKIKSGLIMALAILARTNSLNYDCLNTLPYLREQLYQRFGLLAQLKTTLKKKKKKKPTLSPNILKGGKHTSQVLRSDNFKRAYGQTLVQSFYEDTKDLINLDNMFP